MVEVGRVGDDERRKTTRRKKIPCPRAADEEWQSNQPQRKQWRPAEQVELEDGQELVGIDQPGSQRVPPVKANAVAESEVVRRIEDGPRQEKRITRQPLVVQQVRQHEGQAEHHDLQQRSPASGGHEPRAQRERKQHAGRFA